MNFDGILLVDKPSGWSSFDIVAKVRGVLSAEYKEHTGQKRKIKVGHTGTLDPLATGLMIVVVGTYCKRAQEFSKLDKTYEVQMKLGETSTTGDEEGDKQKVDSRQYTEAEVLDVIQNFVGESMQTPPAYSAVKIDGQRAYNLARQGKEVNIEPRKVKINSINLHKYAYPYVNFVADVSSGTYIRSLVEDIGKKLDTGAYMTELRRTKVGKYVISEAIDIADVSSEKLVD